MKVATPLERVTVRLLPWRAAVPSVPGAAVTVCVLSLVIDVAELVFFLDDRLGGERSRRLSPRKTAVG